MTTQHANLQPSSAARWVQCAASVRLEALFPDEGSESSREGTLAHAVAAEYLRQGQQTPDLEMLGPDVTEEMLDGAELLHDDVHAVRKTLNSCATFRVEERVDCSEIHPECWGTPDVRLLDVAHNVLYLWDYKFGHRYVDPFENWQLLAYAIGALKNYGDATSDSIRIHLRIVQPRSYHPIGPVREWAVYGSELKMYLAKLQAAAALAMFPGDSVAVVGAECRDCKARHTCTTLQESSYSIVQLARAGGVHSLLPGALGRELATLCEAQDILKARINGLEDEVLATLKSGGTVGGWMTQQGTGRQKWNKPVEEVLALGQMMCIDIAKPAAVTPKQAVKAGIPEAVVASYSETPPGEIKLVRDNGVQARKVFNK